MNIFLSTGIRGLVCRETNAGAEGLWQIMLAMANILVFKTINNMLWEAHIKELAILRRHVKLASRHPKLVKIASSVDNNLIHFDF